MKKIIAFVMVFVICFFLLEAGIRMLGYYATQSEKSSGTFTHPFMPQHTGWHYHQTPGLNAALSLPEFSYTHQYDSLGFRNDSIADEYDAIAFGDSFTEGLGAPNDSVWPVALEKISGLKIYNAGVMGSDPAYNFVALKTRLKFLAPQKVIFAVNYSDIYDVKSRGGMERFQPDGSVKYRDAPWFISLYKYSHVFRALLHFGLQYDFMFNAPSEKNAAIDECLNILHNIFLEAQEYCRKENIEMYVFVCPIPQEYYKNLERRTDFKRIDELVPMLEQSGIAVWNLRSDFEKKLPAPDDWRAVSWELDGHFNGKGYVLMGKLIYEKLAASSLQLTVSSF